MKRKYETRLTSHEPRDKFTLSEVEGSDECVGSALILAVVLTSLLAIIGTVFLMVARVDKIATSAITENKELQFALESVVAEISRQLALDVPGNDPNQEYYDYPDPCNAFLAALEPYQSGSYYWRQISDVTGYIRDRGWDANNIPTVIISDHNGIYLNIDGSLRKQRADADGDGVSDSIWIELNNGMATSKGKPVFVAVRLIDNGGMLNVNTAYKFDPTELLPPEELKKKIDGSSQLQINLIALSWRPGFTGYEPLKETDLLEARSNYNVVLAQDLDAYEKNVIWKYTNVNGQYTPFDVSDELELRYRFLLNHTGIDTRLEAWGGEFRNSWVNSTPFRDKDEWFISAFDVGGLDPNYAYRHIATTYNMDRIITPDGEDPCIPNSGRMLNVNRIDPNNNADPNIFDLYNFIRLGFADANFFDNAVAAQLAVNIKDFGDSDADVSVFFDGFNTYYGFEAQPFISEIGIKIDAVAPNDVSNNHFAVELYNPFDVNIPLGDFILSLSNGPNIPLSGIIGPGGFFVVLDSAADFSNPPNCYEDPNLKLSGDYNDTSVPPDGTFEDWDNYDIALKRYIPDTGTDIYLDNQPTDPCWFAQGTEKYIQRDDPNWHIVYEDVNDSDFNPDTLGFTNKYRTAATNYNLALANHNFVTIGDIALPLKIGPNTTPNGTIGRKLSSTSSEDEIRINLADPAYQYQHIFNYLTVMDPAVHISDPNIINETRVKGRININTAPWFVIAQLPWVRPQLAQAIVAYRDKTSLFGGPDYTGRIGPRGFESIGQLNNVIDDADPCLVNYINYYARDVDPNGPLDQLWFPDLTPGDGAANDFEERDLIFSRISNLVTVRSDVFTAYILVRIGVDGPQKRAIAILDRSKVSDVTDRVKLIALHPVPDPR